jgi:hypothetical protein
MPESRRRADVFSDLIIWPNYTIFVLFRLLISSQQIAFEMQEYEPASGPGRVLIIQQSNVCSVCESRHLSSRMFPEKAGMPAMRRYSSRRLTSSGSQLALGQQRKNSL